MTPTRKNRKFSITGEKCVPEAWRDCSDQKWWCFFFQWKTINNSRSWDLNFTHWIWGKLRVFLPLAGSSQEDSLNSIMLLRVFTPFPGSKGDSQPPGSGPRTSIWDENWISFLIEQMCRAGWGGQRGGSSGRLNPAVSASNSCFARDLLLYD